MPKSSILKPDPYRVQRLRVYLSLLNLETLYGLKGLGSRFNPKPYRLSALSPVANRVLEISPE